MLTGCLAMKPLPWRILGVGALAVLALVLGLVRAGCRAVPDEQEIVRNGFGTGSDVLKEMQRQEQLDRRGQVIFWAIGKRSEIVSDLLAGRLTLFEAAAGFRAVEQVKAKYLPPLPLPFPGKSEEEQLCRHVIACVERRLGDKPEQATVGARLQKELQEHLERYGSVHLPASPRLDHPRF
jgi:hypothetical protein